MTDFMIYLEAIAEELVVEELVDDQDLAEDDEEVGGLAGVEQHRIAVILVVEMLLRFTEIIREPVKKSVENFTLGGRGPDRVIYHTFFSKKRK